MNVSSPWYWVTTFGTIICLYNVEMHKAAILWPNSCISCVLTCIIFFVPPHFLFCICFTLISILILSLIHPVFLCLSFSFSPDILCFFIPSFCHALTTPRCSCIYLFCLFFAWTKLRTPQLTALNHDPWPLHHSAGNHPPLWMICSSPLFLDSSLCPLAPLSF